MPCTLIRQSLRCLPLVSFLTALRLVSRIVRILHLSCLAGLRLLCLPGCRRIRLYGISVCLTCFSWRLTAGAFSGDACSFTGQSSILVCAIACTFSRGGFLRPFHRSGICVVRRVSRPVSARSCPLSGIYRPSIQKGPVSR